ncbi:MAG: hypothetical protein ACHQK8_05230 [Bacteroidia bacterium]
MLIENNLIYGLFDEFYFIGDEPFIPRFKGKEIIKQNNTDLKFIGTNKHKTIFLFHDENQLSETGLQMIRNLVDKGIGWKMEDIILLNLSENSQPTLANLTDFFKPEKVLIWGCKGFLESNGIPEKNHEVQKSGSLELLVAKSIAEYETTPALKNQLWNAIQKLFNKK